MRLARICAKRTSSALYSRFDQALIRVRAPRLRSRARIGVTIDERSRSERRKREVVGRGRHPPQLLVADLRPPLGDVPPAALELDQPLGQRRQPGPEPLLDFRVVAPPADPGRDPRHPALVDRVDHADVGELRHDHLGHPLQRLGQRQRAVGDRADRVQEPQALRAAGRALSHPGAEHREPGPQHDQRNPHRELGLVDTRVPARARQRSAEGEQPDRRGRARAGEQRGHERGRDIGSDDRRGLPGERNVGGDRERQHHDPADHAEPASRRLFPRAPPAESADQASHLTSPFFRPLRRRRESSAGPARRLRSSA